MPPSEPKEYWYCQRENGHIVGELVYLELQGGAGRVRALALYEDAYDVEPTSMPRLRGEKVIHALRIACPKCGRKFDWFPSLASLTKLLKRYGG